MNYSTWKHTIDNRRAMISDKLTQACRFLRFIHKQNDNLWEAVQTNSIARVVHELRFILPEVGVLVLSDTAYGLIALYGNLEGDMPQ